MQRETSGHARYLRDRRERIARAWDLRDVPVIIPAGLPIPIAGTDLFHDFHAHNEYQYLAGVAEPGGVLVFDPSEGWSLFLRRPSKEERVWVGDGVPIDQLVAESGIERAMPVDGLAAWLERRRSATIALLGNHDIEHRAGEYGLPGWAQFELAVDVALSGRLSEQVSESRRAKDPWELKLMRAAAEASHRGHMAGLRLARPGMTERQLQIEIEAEFFRAGGDRTAYGSIVAGGEHAAVLHFAPSARPFAEGELILVDAGAEVRGYASDVTRTYPAGDRFEGVQRDLYQLVLRVQQDAIARALPGQEYKELHLDASRQIAAGLVDLGILRGDPADLVDRDAQALFFPHGLGHMLGLATHDAGGCLAGRERSARPTLAYLRADLPLQPGYVVTVEPGVYFIRALLEDPANREQFRHDVDWDRVDAMIDFGGIRIEDDVLVTADGPEILSAATPKAIDDIEAIRRESLRA
ncbi:MAG: aminopeptidase P family protein [Dehalococcoidia bacterium]